MLALQAAGPTLDPRNPCKTKQTKQTDKHGSVFLQSHWGGKDGQIPGTLRPASQAYLESPIAMRDPASKPQDEWHPKNNIASAIQDKGKKC